MIIVLKIIRNLYLSYRFKRKRNKKKEIPELPPNCVTHVRKNVKHTKREV